MPNEITPGTQTSEFKLTVGGVLGMVGAAVASALSGNPTVALILAGISALLVAVYTFGRAVIKKEASGQMDVLSESQEQTLQYILGVIEEIQDALPKDEK